MDMIHMARKQEYSKNLICQRQMDSGDKVDQIAVIQMVALKLAIIITHEASVCVELMALWCQAT